MERKLALVKGWGLNATMVQDSSGYDQKWFQDIFQVNDKQGQQALLRKFASYLKPDLPASATLGCSFEFLHQGSRTQVYRVNLIEEQGMGNHKNLGAVVVKRFHTPK